MNPSCTVYIGQHGTVHQMNPSCTVYIGQHGTVHQMNPSCTISVFIKREFSTLHFIKVSFLFTY